MSLSVFKLSQIKTGHSCLVLGHGASSLAAKIMKKKYDLGIQSGIIFTEDQSDFTFADDLKFKSRFGKKILIKFAKGQMKGQKKRLLVVNSQKIGSKHSEDLVSIMTNPELQTICIIASEDPAMVPENVKASATHVFKLSGEFPTVVESDGHLYHLA